MGVATCVQQTNNLCCGLHRRENNGSDTLHLYAMHTAAYTSIQLTIHTFSMNIDVLGTNL